MGDKTLWDLFQHGGPVMWPLLASSILGLALVLDRLFVFAWWYQRMANVRDALRPLIREGAWAKAEQWCQRRGVYTNLARVYCRYRQRSRRTREDILRREGSIVLGQLEQRLRWLAMLAQIATLLGLLGTFHVMIVRFNQGEAGGPVQPNDFSSAIWEALLTTMFGLMIAIPCSAAYQMFEGQVDTVSREMGILVSYLDEWRKEAEARSEVKVLVDDATPPAKAETPARA